MTWAHALLDMPTLVDVLWMGSVIAGLDSRWTGKAFSLTRSLLSRRGTMPAYSRQLAGKSWGRPDNPGIGEPQVEYEPLWDTWLD